MVLIFFFNTEEQIMVFTVLTVSILSLYSASLTHTLMSTVSNISTCPIPYIAPTSAVT